MNKKFMKYLFSGYSILLFFFSFSILNCSKIDIHLQDTISFDNTTDISVAAIADLDHNRKNEIILASLTYRTNEYGDRELNDTSLFIFEKGNKKYKYIWKSAPLNYLTSDYSIRGEFIYDIVVSSEKEENYVLIYGEKQMYKLFFRKNNYQLIKFKNTDDYQKQNSDIPSYFPFPIRSYYLFSRKNQDYIFLNAGKEKKSKLLIYHINYKKEKQLPKKIAEFFMIPMSSLKVLSSDKQIFMLGCSMNHSLLVYSVNGL